MVSFQTETIPGKYRPIFSHIYILKAVIYLLKTDVLRTGLASEQGTIRELWKHTQS